MAEPDYDVFISYVSSESLVFARGLAAALRKKELRVWIDEDTILIGDSIRTAIDAGIARSRSGAVLLSRSFFNRGWPQKELDGLTQMATSGGNPIFPILVDLSLQELQELSPALAGLKSMTSLAGVDAIAAEVAKRLQRGNVAAPAVFSGGLVEPTAISTSSVFDWDEADSLFEELRAAAPAIVIQASPSRFGTGTMQNMKSRLAAAARRSRRENWPPFGGVDEVKSEWYRQGVILGNHAEYFWAIQPSGAFQYGSTFVNWYHSNGVEGFGFQRLLFELAESIVLAARFTTEQELDRSKWLLRVEFRGAQNQPLVADHGGGNLSLKHRSLDERQFATCSVDLPSSTEEIEFSLASITENVFFPFTLRGDPPLPPGLALRVLRHLNEVNHFWVDLPKEQSGERTDPA